MGDGVPTSVATDAATSFGRYTLVAKLATGGMADIFLARYEGVAGFERPVVVKRILPQLAEDEQFVSMFLDEARIAARLTHPNICQVYELGRIEGRYFIAMEYLEGVPLTSILRQVEKVPRAGDLRLVAGLFTQACEGLHQAHELKDLSGTSLNLVHRDVSPQNLYVTIDGVLKVLDFGVAKAQFASSKTRTGTLKGKYAYMSPEQLRGEPLDRRSDVFALGIVLFGMVTGRHLFKRSTEYLTFKAITEEPLMRVAEFRDDVPPELVEVIAQALSRDREQRFATARALGDAVSRAILKVGPPLGQAALAEEVQALCGAEIAERRAFIARGGAPAEAGKDYVETVATRAVDQTVSDQRPVPAFAVLPPAGAPAAPAPAPALAAAPTAILAPALAAAPTAILAPALAAAPTAVIAPALAAAPTAILAPAAAPAPEATPTPTATLLPAPAAVATAARPRRSVLLIGAVAAVALVAAMVIWHVARRAPEPAPVRVPPETPTVVVKPASAPAPVAAASAPADGGPRLEPRASSPVRRPPTEARASAAAAAPGFFTVDSEPYATIYVDGKKLGDTPLFRVKVPAGRHRVRAVSARGGTQSFGVTISPGKEAPPKRLVW
jgi:eukaryotic-like serine/threonine-protein kinase